MRCPKCGYNSFDHLDSCKKCGKDLLEHKQKFGIVSVLFPGQMTPVDQAAEDESVVADVVAAATAAAVSTATAEADGAAAFTADDAAPKEAGEADDFGFDFMGDSEEEEDLSFDELFEEAPADEDVEETLPSPEQETAADKAGDEFAFDMNGDEAAAGDAGLEDDFGFDPSDKTAEGTDSLEADDFELPPAEKDDFSFDTDNVEFENSEEQDAGTEGDPKSPFDLPESSQQEEAPEETFNLFVAEPETGSIAIEEDDLLLTEVPVAEPEQPLVDEPAALGVIEAPEPEKVVPVEPLQDEPLVGAESDPEVIVVERRESELQPASEQAESEADESAEAPSHSKPPPVAAAVVEVAATARSLAAGDGAAIEETEAELLPATGSRIAAFCCDLLLLVVVGTSFVIAAEAAISTSGESLLPSMETLIDLSVPYFLVLFSLAFGYFTLFHFLAGQTPGKMLAGLRVETITGGPLLFSQAFLRSVGGLLQMLPAGLGYLVILSSPDRRGWNDQLAGTRLVSLRGMSEEV